VEATDKLRIGQLAARLELNPRTIRFYEQAGVLPEPERTVSNYRLYSPEDERRLRFIKTAQRLGLTLGEIKEILAVRDRGERPCSYVANVIEQRLREVDERMRDLRVLKQELGELRERMAEQGSDEAGSPYCHYIETTVGSSRD
jgi:DNA-binding transcriptional MerR regulator